MALQVWWRDSVPSRGQNYFHIILRHYLPFLLSFPYKNTEEFSRGSVTSNVANMDRYIHVLSTWAPQ